MTNSELERLAILVEEAAEVQQIAMKIIRHGYASYNPFDETKTTNRKLLEKEIGDLIFAINFLLQNNDVDDTEIQERERQKIESVKKYLHYNEV